MMATMRDIKRRKDSISSIQQITKAMKLVSTVKLQKTKTRAEQAKPYFDEMYAVITSVLSRSGEIDLRYLKPASEGRKVVIAVTSNRGLAGGYSANVVKKITSENLKKVDVDVYAVGKKGKEALEKKGYEIKKDYSDMMNDPRYEDAKEIGTTVLREFSEGRISEIYLAYTCFKNTVVHEPKLLKLLPIEMDTSKPSRGEALVLMNYEPKEEEALEIIIPKYINSIIYGALMEAAASENGARMQAMDSATSNAEEMINKLSLQYNRARQGSITQELTEIIAGAEAVD